MLARLGLFHDLNFQNISIASCCFNSLLFYARWSQGLLFHQAMVDCARAAILIPLAVSIMRCEPVKKCSLVETAFLLLVNIPFLEL